MDNIIVEQLNDTNITAVEEISKLSFHTHWSLDSIKKELSNPHANYVVLKNSNNYIGFGGAWILFDEANVTNIAVHPKYRGMGYGNIILDALIDNCKKSKASSITLEVRKSNIIAQKLYEKHGFEVEAIRKDFYSNPKEDGLIMWNRKI